MAPNRSVATLGPSQRQFRKPDSSTTKHMDLDFEELLVDFRLARIAPQLRATALPAIGMSLSTKPISQNSTATSKLGGCADLPADFQWPQNKGRPLDFLLQVNLLELHTSASNELLPSSGLLSFFYDLEEQPWGYDPLNLDGFKVVYTPELTGLKSYDVTDAELALRECSICFHPILTIPHYESLPFQNLLPIIHLTDKEIDAYFALMAKVNDLQYETTNNGYHRLLGHSTNIQGDMQLEAQLVTNGLYCGDSSGYTDSRRKTLEAGAEDWTLLLQLDSNDETQLMWGDIGMLYFWIRKDELARLHFDNVWMTLQCG